MEVESPIIIDNFLDYEDFTYLFDIVKEIHYRMSPLAPLKTKPEPDNHILFAHLLYDFFSPRSDYFKEFWEILFSNFHSLGDEFSVNAIIRSKINCYPQTADNVIHFWHCDRNHHHKGAIFSFNDCDGYTEILGYGKIQSKANRLFLFDPSVPHRSTSCTDQSFRFNVVINYF